MALSEYSYYSFFQVCEKCETVKHAEQELWWSHVSLEIPLFSNHFNGGRLALRCIAEVETLYQEGIERILYSEKDPIPERGKFAYCKLVHIYYLRKFIYI